MSGLDFLRLRTNRGEAREPEPPLCLGGELGRCGSLVDQLELLAGGVKQGQHQVLSDDIPLAEVAPFMAAATFRPPLGDGLEGLVRVEAAAEGKDLAVLAKGA